MEGLNICLLTISLLFCLAAIVFTLFCIFECKSTNDNTGKLEQCEEEEDIFVNRANIYHSVYLALGLLFLILPARFS